MVECTQEPSAKSMKSLLLVLAISLLSGCASVVQREISLYPEIESRLTKERVTYSDSRRLSIDGSYFRRVILKFELDDSILTYVNRQLDAETLSDVHALKIVDFGFSSHTKVWTLPVARTTRFAFLEVQFQRSSDGYLFRSKVELEISVPPADHFLGLSSRDNGIDDEILGKSMAEFVAKQFELIVAELVRKQKEPRATARRANSG